MDITANIKAIEALKCALLTDMAALYEAMRKPARPEDRDEPLADMLVTVYLLAGKLGLNHEALDELAIQRLRREDLGDDRAAETRALLKHIGRITTGDSNQGSDRNESNTATGRKGNRQKGTNS